MSIKSKNFLNFFDANFVLKTIFAATLNNFNSTNITYEQSC
jgi:hypothetical protein